MDASSLDASQSPEQMSVPLLWYRSIPAAGCAQRSNPEHFLTQRIKAANLSGVGLELHQPTVERMRENYSKRGVELNEARLRMAKLPQTSQVVLVLHAAQALFPSCSS